MVFLSTPVCWATFPAHTSVSVADVLLARMDTASSMYFTRSSGCSMSYFLSALFSSYSMEPLALSTSARNAAAPDFFISSSGSFAPTTSMTPVSIPAARSISIALLVALCPASSES